jgi:hypothetical protein
MPTIELTEQTLTVRLSPVEKLASLRRSLIFNWSQVRGATSDANAQQQFGIRAPGTALPGVVAAGTFFKNGDRQFVLWKKGDQPVVIELNHPRWDRLIIGTHDARALVAAINSRVL